MVVFLDGLLSVSEAVARAGSLSSCVMPGWKTKTEDEDEEATQAHRCFAEFSGGGGWGLKSLFNIQIKQFQA